MSSTVNCVVAGVCGGSVTVVSGLIPGDTTSSTSNLNAINTVAASGGTVYIATPGTIVANNQCMSDSTQAANGWKQQTNTTLVY